MKSTVGRLELWLLLCLALVVCVDATQEQIAAAQARKLLADRAWFSQIARIKADGSTRASPPADATVCASDDAGDDAGDAACLAVTERLQPGATVEGYELVERTALLGVCNQPSSGSGHADKGGSSGEVDHLPVPSQSDALELLSPPLLDREATDDASSEESNEEDTDREVVDDVLNDNGSQTDAARHVCPLPLGSSADVNAQVVASTTSQSTGLVDGPTLEYQCVLEDVGLIYVNANYRLNTKFDAGSHGEVWKATARHRRNTDEHFILKRLFLNLGEQMVQMGLREAHFGRLLASEPHVTRFVEYFFRPVAAATTSTEENRGEQAENTLVQELWLVFYDEGISLRHYLYSKKRVAGHAGVIFEPSLFWRKLRTDANGEHVFREIMRQLLQGVAALHARGITHRDIKPSNILVNIENGNDSVPIVKLADFGSAVDDFTLRHLYPRDRGPSQAEETREYQPPEVLFHELGQPYDYASPFSYDLWSVGVVFLEMLLGSPQVFMISPRARAKLDAKLRGKDEATKVKSYLLHVLTQEFCIFQPPPHQLRALWQNYAVSSDGCNFGAFNLTIINRDPLRKGLKAPWGIDLMWKLLQWHPSQRIPAAQALEHAFFKGAYVCKKSGRSFATQQELVMHEAYLAVQEARDNEMAFVVREKYELPSEFTCPHCHRHFATVASCEQHLHARKHDVAAHTHFCHFDAHRLKDAVMKETEEYIHNLQCAPSKDSVHGSNVPKLPMGMALFQGRKKYMEDFLLVQKANTELGFELYAVSDGHLGTRAAAFVIDNLMRITAKHFAALPTITPDADDDAKVKAEREFAEQVALRQTFLELQDGFLAEIGSTDANDQADFSGCTLTVVLYFREQRRLVSANVGDSRAIAIFADEDKESDASSWIVPLSMDHWPHVDEERTRIESSGGFVSFAGLWRVVGQLAVSRSIGDQHLRQYVAAEPSVFHTKVTSDGMLVVASDGLWETMTNEDVQRFVREQRTKAGKDERPLSSTELEDMAQDLVIEGYVRGSQDNIALTLVELGAESEPLCAVTMALGLLTVLEQHLGDLADRRNEDVRVCGEIFQGGRAAEHADGEPAAGIATEHHVRGRVADHDRVVRLHTKISAERPDLLSRWLRGQTIVTTRERIDHVAEPQVLERVDGWLSVVRRAHGDLHVHVLDRTEERADVGERSTRGHGVGHGPALLDHCFRLAGRHTFGHEHLDRKLVEFAHGRAAERTFAADRATDPVVAHGVEELLAHGETRGHLDLPRLGLDPAAPHEVEIDERAVLVEDHERRIAARWTREVARVRGTTSGTADSGVWTRVEQRTGGGAVDGAEGGRGGHGSTSAAAKASSQPSCTRVGSQAALNPETRNNPTIAPPSQPFGASACGALRKWKPSFRGARRRRWMQQRAACRCLWTEGLYNWSNAHTLTIVRESRACCWRKRRSTTSARVLRKRLTLDFRPLKDTLSKGLEALIDVRLVHAELAHYYRDDHGYSPLVLHELRVSTAGDRSVLHRDGRSILRCALQHDHQGPSRRSSHGDRSAGHEITVYHIQVALRSHADFAQLLKSVESAALVLEYFLDDATSKALYDRRLIATRDAKHLRAATDDSTGEEELIRMHERRVAEARGRPVQRSGLCDGTQVRAPGIHTLVQRDDPTQRRDQ